MSDRRSLFLTTIMGFVTAVILVFALSACSDDTTRPDDGTPPLKAWVHSAGGPDFDGGSGIATDGSGNVVVTGGFTDSAAFGDTTLTSGGGSDVFVAKYDPAGNVLWARSAGGSDDEEGYGVTVDGSGNMLVTGTFHGSATFGITTLTSAGEGDIFIAKYDAAGNVLWAHSAGGSDFESCFGVTTDGSANVVVTGDFRGSATFGDTTLTSAGATDVFIAKYDAAGIPLWARSAGVSNEASGRGVATDESLNVVVTGDFRGSATFGDMTLTSGSGSDVFVAKYDPAGNVLWARSDGGSSTASGSSVAICGSGNVVVTGFFHGSATFGISTLTSAGGSDIFIAKYDSAGNLLWAHSAGGSSTDAGHDVAADGSGNVIVTGYISGSAAFGGTTLTSFGALDVFAAKYDAAGNPLWAYSAGGSNNDIAFGVATDGLGNVFVTGYCIGPVTFGTTTLTGAGSADVFVARMGSSGF